MKTTISNFFARLYSALRQARNYFSWHALNPLNWSTRTVKVFVAAFFTIMLPIYLLIGFMPAVPADALNYPRLHIPSIQLDTPVATVELVDHQLTAPATIAGAYYAAPHKVFLLGHSTTVFRQLEHVQLGDHVEYDGQTYHIVQMDTPRKETISMKHLLKAETQDTIVIMTCAGELLENQDATHRLIITAVAD